MKISYIKKELKAVKKDIIYVLKQLDKDPWYSAPQLYLDLEYATSTLAQLLASIERET